MNDNESDWIFEDEPPPREPEPVTVTVTVKLVINPWFVALGTSKPQPTAKGDAA